MICFQNELPAVIWHGGKPIPLTMEWVVETIDDAAKRAHMDKWVWSADVAAAVKLYFRHDFEYATITPSELVDILKQTLKAIGKEEMANELLLSPPLTSIDLTELARAANIEITFYQLLKDRLQEAFDFRVRSIRLNGMKQCVKMLIGRKRYRESCKAVSEQIESYVRYLASRTSSVVVDIQVLL